MKRILSLLTALVLVLLPTLAMAETTGAYASYVDPQGRYAFQYPSGWLVINKDTVDSLIEAVSGLGSSEAATVLETTKQQLTQNDMVSMISPDFQANINLMVLSNSGIPDVNVLMSNAEGLKEQLTAQMETIAFISEPYILTLGKHEVFMVDYTYEMGGASFQGGQYYVINGADAYFYILTAPAGDITEYAEALGAVIGSTTFQ